MGGLWHDCFRAPCGCELARLAVAGALRDLVQVLQQVGLLAREQVHAVRVQVGAHRHVRIERADVHLAHLRSRPGGSLTGRTGFNGPRRVGRLVDFRAEPGLRRSCTLGAPLSHVVHLISIPGSLVAVAARKSPGPAFPSGFLINLAPGRSVPPASGRPCRATT